MKTQNLLPLSFVAALALFLSVGKVYAEDMVAKAYDIKDVTSVIVTGGGQLRLTQGDTESLRVEARSDVINRVTVDLSGNKLRLSVKNNVGRGFNIFHWFDNGDPGDPVIYILQVKNLQALDVSGGTRAKVGNFTVKNFELRCSGAAEADFGNFKFNDLFAEQSGASRVYMQALTGSNVKFQLSGAANTDIKAESQVKVLQLDASGASNFHGKLLTAAQADVGASGASNIELNVTEFLKADASGASNVRYLGLPKLQSNTSGASHVNAIN